MAQVASWLKSHVKVKELQIVPELFKAPLFFLSKPGSFKGQHSVNAGMTLKEVATALWDADREFCAWEVLGYCLNEGESEKSIANTIRSKNEDAFWGGEEPGLWEEVKRGVKKGNEPAIPSLLKEVVHWGGLMSFRKRTASSLALSSLENWQILS